MLKHALQEFFFLHPLPHTLGHLHEYVCECLNLQTLQHNFPNKVHIFGGNWDGRVKQKSHSVSERFIKNKSIQVHEVYENCDEVKGIMLTSYQTTLTVIKLCMRESYQSLTVVGQLMKLLPEAGAGAPGHSLRYSVC